MEVPEVTHSWSTLSMASVLKEQRSQEHEPGLGNWPWVEGLEILGQA